MSTINSQQLPSIRKKKYVEQNIGIRGEVFQSEQYARLLISHEVDLPTRLVERYQTRKKRYIGKVLKYNKRKVLCKYKIIFRNRQAYISNLIKQALNGKYIYFPFKAYFTIEEMKKAQRTKNLKTDYIIGFFRYLIVLNINNNKGSCLLIDNCLLMYA